MIYKPFDLTGRVALATGGNGGIGLGMTDALTRARLGFEQRRQISFELC